MSLEKKRNAMPKSELFEELDMLEQELREVKEDKARVISDAATIKYNTAYLLVDVMVCSTVKSLNMLDFSDESIRDLFQKALHHAFRVSDEE